jgi:hypothetical protein
LACATSAFPAFAFAAPLSSYWPGRVSTLLLSGIPRVVRSVVLLVLIIVILVLVLVLIIIVIVIVIVVSTAAGEVIVIIIVVVLHRFGLIGHGECGHLIRRERRFASLALLGLEDALNEVLFLERIALFDVEFLGEFLQLGELHALQRCLVAHAETVWNRGGGLTPEGAAWGPGKWKMECLSERGLGRVPGTMTVQ